MMTFLGVSATRRYYQFVLGMALAVSLEAPKGSTNTLISYFSKKYSRLSGFTVGMVTCSADAIILVLIFFTRFARKLTNLVGNNLLLVGGIVMIMFAIVIAKSFIKQQFNYKYSGLNLVFLISRV